MYAERPPTSIFSIAQAGAKVNRRKPSRKLTHGLAMPEMLPRSTEMVAGSLAQATAAVAAFGKVARPNWQFVQALLLDYNLGDVEFYWRMR
jgi:hypothetical protein